MWDPPTCLLFKGRSPKMYFWQQTTFPQTSMICACFLIVNFSYQFMYAVVWSRSSLVHGNLKLHSCSSSKKCGYCVPTTSQAKIIIAAFLPLISRSCLSTNTWLSRTTKWIPSLCKNGNFHANKRKHNFREILHSDDTIFHNQIYQENTVEDLYIQSTFFCLNRKHNAHCIYLSGKNKLIKKEVKDVG